MIFAFQPPQGKISQSLSEEQRIQFIIVSVFYMGRKKRAAFPTSPYTRPVRLSGAGLLGGPKLWNCIALRIVSRPVPLISSPEKTTGRHLEFAGQKCKN